MSNYYSEVDLSKLENSSLVSPDLLPTKKEDRHLSNKDMYIMWVGMSVLLTTFTIGSSLYPSLSVANILWAAVLGNGIVIGIMALTGDIGITYGIPFAVYLRVIYGYFGTHIPSIIRALPAVFWFGFQSFLGATAINSLLFIVTGGGWPGNFTTMIIVLILFLAVQAWTTAKGIGAISWFENMVSPVMIAIAIYMLYWILTKNGVSISEILSTPAGDVAEGQTRYSFGYAVTSCTGYWATMSLNILDLTRYYKVPEDAKTWGQRNGKLVLSQALGIIITVVFFCFIGVAAMVATGLWSPVDVIIAMNAPMILTIAALIVAALAQWSTNIAANILPPANIWANVFAPKVNFKMGCMISAVMAFAMCTWKYGNYLVTIFAYIGAGLGAIAGTMVVDYYILRKRKINVMELYKINGQYRYANNFNPCGYLAYIVGFIAGLLVLDWAFIVSCIVGGIVYFVSMRYWGAKKYNQTEIIEAFNIH